MQKTNTLKDWIQSKVATVTAIKTFKFGYVYDINAIMRNAEYPLFVMIPPDFVRKNYTPVARSTNSREYTFVFWIHDHYTQAENDDMEDSYTDLEDMGFSCLDAIFSEYNFLTPSRDVSFEFYPEENNDKTRAVKITIKGTMSVCYSD